MKHFILIIVAIFYTNAYSKTGVIDSTINYSIGDAKLSYAPLNVNNPTWVYINGATVFPLQYPVFYPILGSTEIVSSTQTQTSPSPINTGQYGQYSVWLPDKTLLTSQISVINTVLSTGYIIPWNETTRTLGTPSAISNSIWGSVLGDATNINGVYFPYYILRSRTTNTNQNSVFKVLKWNGSSLSLMQTINTSLLNALGYSIIKDFSTQDYYFLATLNQQSHTPIIFKKPFGSETWSSTGSTVSLGSTITSIPSYTWKPYLLSKDYMLIQGTNGTTGVQAALEIYKLNTSTNVYQPFQVICSGATALFGCMVPYGAASENVIIDFTPGQIEFMVSVSQQLCGYRFNGTNFSQIACNTSPVGGIVPNGYMFLAHRSAWYDFSGVDEKNAIIYFYNGSTYTFRFAKYNSTTMQFSALSNTAVTFVNNFPGPQIPFFDGYGSIAYDNGTNVQGALQVYPLRKTLPNLADPATGLKYQIKVK